MPIEDVRFGITLAAPGADSNDYVLLDTTTATPPINLTAMGIDRLQLAWNNAQAATLVLKMLRPGTTATWDTVVSTSVSAGAGLTASPYDWEVVGLGDVQLVVTNGGSAQTRWPPVLTGTRGQKASGT